MKAVLVVLAAAIGTVVCTAGLYTSGKPYNTSPPPPYGPSMYTKPSAPATYGSNMKAAPYTPYNNPPANYQYQYRVHDDYPPGPASAYGYGGPSYSNIPLDFGAQENRQGDYVKGSYDVLLPDGRRETVNYYVDGYSGFVADVKYTQEVTPPPYTPSYPMPGTNYADAPAPGHMESTPYNANPYNPTYNTPYMTPYMVDPPNNGTRR